MRSSATAERQAPRLGVIVSVLLHTGLMMAMIVTFTRKLDIIEQVTPIVPVDLVTVAEKTNIAPTVTPEPVAPPPETAPPEPAMIEPAPQPELTAPKFEIANPEEKPKQEKFDINNIIASLSKNPQAKTGARNIQGAGAQTGMTADLAAILQSEIYRCWSPPVGAPHAERLIVTYEVFLNRDGTVAQPPQLSPDLAAAEKIDPYVYAADRAAERAIYACQPYKLPANRYSEWRNFKFVFDPRYLTGQ